MRHRDRQSRMLMAGSFALAVVTTLICIGAALAHDATPTALLPQGWSYPFQCCANYDCEQIQDSDISEPSSKTNGYTIKKTGEIVPWGDQRIKDSPDGKFHWCAHKAGLDAGKTICLFVPPPSY